MTPNQPHSGEEMTMKDQQEKAEALADVKFIRKELGRTWLNQRQREVTEDIHARLNRIEAALSQTPQQGQCGAVSLGIKFDSLDAVREISDREQTALAEAGDKYKALTRTEARTVDVEGLKEAIRLTQTAIDCCKLTEVNVAQKILDAAKLYAQGHLHPAAPTLDLNDLQRAREEFYNGDGFTSEETNDTILALLDNAIAAQGK